MKINVEGLKKVYKKGKQALNGIDLEINNGLFGLLGPNGAGKSTMINILAGLVTKTMGNVNIWGMDIDKDPRNAKMAIGIVPQELNIDPFFTPRALLNIHAGLYGIPENERRTEEILDMIGLLDKAEAYARTLSGGMRRRLLIGKAMVHNPPILVLDEPTAGVDVELRQQLWENVLEMNKKGTTVVLTTHYLEEAQELCDEIAIINHGKLIVHDSKRELLARIDAKRLSVTVLEPLDVIPDNLNAFETELSKDEKGRSVLTFSYHARKITAGTLLGAVAEAKLTIHDVSTDEADLEDIFLQLTRNSPDKNAA